ncbi:MAG: elongation factor G [Trueperaceae bacterium]|nr:elongation factor G [Trueperaceae bacterium]
MSELRNVALLSHSGAGKTSLTEALLYRTGVLSAMGAVEDGTTASDRTPEETRRKISVTTSLHPVTWKGHPFTILDAPGYADFVGEIRGAQAAADAAAIVVSAVSGVAVGTERVWTSTFERELSSFVVINKMDRENADFFRTMAQIEATLPGTFAAIQVPIGKADAFRGVVDLLTMTAWTWPDGTPTEGALPEEVAGVAQEYHDRLVEAIVETDDELMARYLEDVDIAAADLREAFFAAVRGGALTPVLCASAETAMGIDLLLDFMVEGVRTPAEHAPLPVVDGDAPTLGPDAPFLARVVKTAVDPYLGKISYLRVLAGSVRAGDAVLNTAHEDGAPASVKLAHLYVPDGGDLNEVAALEAGAIGAVTKVDALHTGDTLAAPERPVQLAPIRFPPPVMAVALEPATRADDDKLGEALRKLLEADPTLHLERDPDTQETVLWGMGHVHLEVAKNALKDRYGVTVHTHPPKVAYRETIRGTGEARHRHKKQTGGAGQFAEVALRVEPAEAGAGLVFDWAVVGGAIPSQFQSSCEKGVRQAMDRGVLGGFVTDDVHVTVVDGKDHPVDSKDVAFVAAAAQAFREAAQQADPVLMEPVALVKVRVPDRYTGDVIGDLNARRGRILGMDNEGAVSTVSAHVPEAELATYSPELRSLTGGRGAFSRRQDHYAPVPPHLVERILDAARADAEDGG